MVNMKIQFLVLYLLVGLSFQHDKTCIDISPNCAHNSKQCKTSTFVQGKCQKTCNLCQECTPKCQNGGTCNTESECECSEGWSGDACDIKAYGQDHGGSCKGQFMPGKWTVGYCEKKCSNGTHPLSNHTCNKTGGGDCQCCAKGCDHKSYISAHAGWFPAGSFIGFNVELCLGIKCNSTGDIVQYHPIGPSALILPCCECSGKLFPKNSRTCEAKDKNKKCPGQCHESGKDVAHGDITEYLPEECALKRCLNGTIKKEYKLGKGMKRCCLDLKDEKYPLKKVGDKMDDGGCLARICKNGNWVPSHNTIMDKCKKGYAWGDPHFISFNGVEFDWHDGCNYALVQEIDSVDPEFGVFMQFKREGAVAIVGPTTYQETYQGVKGTKIGLQPGNLLWVKVGGNSEHLRTGFNRVTPSVDVWEESGCLRLYGIRKILVELCKTTITIWAPPENPFNFRYKLGGLFGSTGVTALKNKMLVSSGGVEYHGPGRLKDAHSAFGQSWKADDQPNNSCAMGRRKRSSRIPRSAKTDAAKIRENCAASVDNSPNREKCGGVIDRERTGELFEYIFMTCLFDLCIAAEDPEQIPAGFTELKMLEQQMEIASRIEFHMRSTIETLPDEKQCPFGWNPVDGQCYQVHKFDGGYSLDDAHQSCISKKSTLASLSKENVAELNYFIKDSLVNGEDESQRYCQFIPPDHCIEIYKTCPQTCYVHEKDDCKYISQARCNNPRDSFARFRCAVTCSKGPYWLGGRIGLGEVMEWIVGGGNLPNTQIRYVHIENKTTAIRSSCLTITEADVNDDQDCLIPEAYICEREPLACGDNHHDCAWRAADGECEVNKFYMYNTCKESCNVPCECDQPLTCTELGGICQPFDATCNGQRDTDLCHSGDCTCCLDDCQDSGEHNCQTIIENGDCNNADYLDAVKEHCKRSCGFCA